MKAAIAANAPVRAPLPSGTALPPGTLQSDITVVVTKDAPDSFSAWIEPGKFSRHVARFVEWGHRMTRGKGKNSVVLKVRKNGVELEDVPAHPYIRPAFDANEDVAFEATAESLATDINAAAKQRGLG
jgi:hypothetical protein